MLTPQGIAFATPDDLGDLTNYRRFCRAMRPQPRTPRMVYVGIEVGGVGWLSG